MLVRKPLIHYVDVVVFRYVNLNLSIQDITLYLHIAYDFLSIFYVWSKAKENSILIEVDHAEILFVLLTNGVNPIIE